MKICQQVGNSSWLIAAQWFLSDVTVCHMCSKLTAADMNWMVSVEVSCRETQHTDIQCEALTGNTQKNNILEEWQLPSLKDWKRKKFPRNHLKEFQTETDWIHESEWVFLSERDRHVQTELSVQQWFSDRRTLFILNTETLRKQVTGTRTQIQDAEVLQWMWCWRCGGGSVCQRRLCRRTECQQDGPHTLLLC